MVVGGGFGRHGWVGLVVLGCWHFFSTYPCCCNIGDELFQYYEFKGSGGALITKLDFGEYLLQRKTIFTLKTIANVYVLARTVRQDYIAQFYR